VILASLLGCGPGKNLTQESKNICRKSKDRSSCARLAMLMEERAEENDAQAAAVLGVAVGLSAMQSAGRR